MVTAVMMLVTGWVSSRIGAKRTLISGLILIVVFAALAVASASGGFGGAIVLYETALGVGIATGPLLGGLLGNISWRGPFFGVAALMASWRPPSG